MPTRTCRVGDVKTHYKQSLKSIGQRSCATVSELVAAEMEILDGGIGLVIFGRVARHGHNMCLVRGMSSHATHRQQACPHETKRPHLIMWHHVMSWDGVMVRLLLAEFLLPGRLLPPTA